jgi:hypothetical protein
MEMPGLFVMSYSFPMDFSHMDIMPLDEALAEPVAHSTVNTEHTAQSARAPRAKSPQEKINQ